MLRIFVDKYLSYEVPCVISSYSLISHKKFASKRVIWLAIFILCSSMKYATDFLCTFPTKWVMYNLCKWRLRFFCTKKVIKKFKKIFLPFVYHGMLYSLFHILHIWYFLYLQVIWYDLFFIFLYQKTWS